MVVVSHDSQVLSRFGHTTDVSQFSTHAALAGGDRVIPVAYPGRGGRPIERGRSGSHLVNWPGIEAWLEQLEPIGAVPSGDVLRRMVLEGGVRGPVVLVSDLMVPSWQDLITGVGVASGGVVIHVVGPSDEQPEIAGDVRIVDAETGSEVDVSATRTALAEYTDRYQDFIGEAARISRRSGMDYIRITAGPDALRAGIDALAGHGVIG